MIQKLGYGYMAQQTRACITSWDRPARCIGLMDLVIATAAILGPYMLDDSKRSWNIFQLFADVFRKCAQGITAYFTTTLNFMSPGFLLIRTLMDPADLQLMEPLKLQVNGSTRFAG